MVQDNKHQNLDVKINSLEKDHERFLTLVERMDTSIVKLTELASSIKQMLAVQELRIDGSENRHDSMERRFDKIITRLEDLEKWRWYLTGAVFLIGFVTPYVITYLKHHAP